MIIIENDNDYIEAIMTINTSQKYRLNFIHKNLFIL